MGHNEPPLLIGTRDLEDNFWTRTAAAARLIPPPLNLHFGEAHQQTTERARELEEAVDMEGLVLAQQLDARRHAQLFESPPPIDEAQMIYDATVDDGNVSSMPDLEPYTPHRSSGSARDFVSLDAYNLETPPQSAPD